MKKEKYLPLGSVVLLKGASKKIMIVGYLSYSFSQKTEIYDYMGCLYPEGIISSDKNLLFNHDQIDEIYYLGYSDDEEKIFEGKLKNIENQI